MLVTPEKQPTQKRKPATPSVPLPLREVAVKWKLQGRISLVKRPKVEIDEVHFDFCGYCPESTERFYWVTDGKKQITHERPFRSACRKHDRDNIKMSHGAITNPSFVILVKDRSRVFGDTLRIVREVARIEVWPGCTPESLAAALEKIFS